MTILCGTGFLKGSDFADQIRGAYLDASTYLTRGQLANVVDGQAGTLSLWTRVRITPPNVSDNWYMFSICASGGSSGVTFQKYHTDSTPGPVGDGATCGGVAPGGTTRFGYNLAYANGPGGVLWTVNAWQHTIISWNMANSGQDVFGYWGDQSVVSAAGSQSSGNISYTKNRVNVGADAFDNDQRWQGDMAEFFWIPQYIDLSVTANRRKFISADGRPVNLGDDGSLPFGAVPTIYLSARESGSAGFATNRGNGGPFTLVGSLAESPTQPAL